MLADALNGFLEDLKGKEPEEAIDYESIIKDGENDYVEFNRLCVGILNREISTN